jgi:hypothetical protein
VVVVFFAAVMFAPWLDRFRPAEASGPREAELRDPAPSPGSLLGTLFGDDRPGSVGRQRYPAAFEEHFNDTFGFRDWFLRGHSLVKLFVFGVSPTPRVLVGKDGWLFYTGGKTIEDYRGVYPFTDEELERWQRMLEARERFLAQRGIAYVFAIVPNKEEIYREYMPDSIESLGPCRTDQLVEHLRAHTTVDVLDLRPALTAAKEDPSKESEPYLRLGTHWNGAGSYAAYVALIEHLRTRLPELSASLPLEAFKRIDVAGNSDSWGRAMYIDDLLNQNVIKYVPRTDLGVRAKRTTGLGSRSEHTFTCDTAPAVKAMFFHDSFGPCNYDLLATSFERLSCHWRADFPNQLIVDEQPDVVIEQYVQRWLVNKHPDPPGPWKVMDDAGFEALDEVLLRLDFPEDIGTLASVGACRVVALAGDQGEDRDAGARIEFGRRSDLLRLPKMEPGGGEATLMLDLTAPDEGRLTVYYALAGQELPLRRHSFRMRFSAGRSRIYVPLDDARETGRLFLWAPKSGGPIVLHAAEARVSGGR